MRSIEFITESQQTTLDNLYAGNYPDRDESIWDEVGTMDLDKPLTIHTMPRHKVQIMLLSQYRVEHLDDLVDMMDEDQKEFLEKYMNDPSLSNKVIVVSDNRIIDGNHRALAAAFKNVSINYVDLAELDSAELEETAQSPWRWDGDEKFRKFDSTITSNDI